jgi:capsular exopolysaccharide synthesis family protein
MSKLFEALQQLETGNDRLTASFGIDAQAILQQPVLTREVLGDDQESAAPSAVAVAAEAANTPRMLPVRLTIEAPLLPFEPKFKGVAEQYRIVRTKIVQHPTAPRVIAITSVDPGDGKTTSSVNVAAALALKTETKVLLVDCDLRRGRINALLGLPKEPGLSDVLVGKASFNETVIQVEQYPNLFVLGAGTPSINPTEALDSENWRMLVGHLRQQFDYVILDTPPIGLVADTDLIHQVTDGLVLVVRPDFTNRTHCMNALASIPPKSLLGVLLNAVTEPYLGRHQYYEYTATPKK